ncbi:hypothetical protein GGR54DRAFT_615472 [Hypoxylon sp. NC1633]|nr:hypothetical protein GGR54DRAFT_615472 [Hypoxylon sp. NC1633]
MNSYKMTRERDSKNRRFGLAKKADAYSRLFAANAAVIIQDQGQFYLYTSCPKFIPELLGTLHIPPENMFEPGTFESVSESKKRNPSPSFSFSSRESSTLSSRKSSTLSSRESSTLSSREPSTLETPTETNMPQARQPDHSSANLEPVPDTDKINESEHSSTHDIYRKVLSLKEARPIATHGAVKRLLNSAYFT